MNKLRPLLVHALLTLSLAAREPSPPAPASPPPSPAEVPASASAPEAPAPAAPAAPGPAAEDGEARRPDGGVPVKAAEFQGMIEGAVETISDRHISFKIKITKATASDKSKAADPAALVGAVVKVRQDYFRKPDGTPAPCPGHKDYVSSLKPGDIIKVCVRYSKSTNSLKLTAVPKP